MPNDNLYLATTSVTTEWQPVLAPMDCNTVEITGDQDWQWCTDPMEAEQSNAYRMVLKFSREVVASIPHWTGSGDYDRRVRFRLGEEICQARATSVGMLWLKCER